MPDETDKGVTPEPVAQVAAAAVVPEAETPEAEKFDEAKAKELIAKLRDIEKKGKADAKRLADLEKAEQVRADAQKSELQKAQERADKAEQDAKALKLSIARRDAAAEAKLSPELADRLVGETPEELKADAIKLKAALPTVATARTDTTNPAGPSTNMTDQQWAAFLNGQGQMPKG